MFVFGVEGKIKKAVDDTIRSLYGKALGEGADAVRLSVEIVDLKKKLVELEIQQANKQEGWDRKEREIEHKIGLERKRQEFEIDAASKSASLKVREENLKADQDRFKAEMDFQRTRLEGEVNSLRDLTKSLLERLPDAQIIADISGSKRR